MEAADASVVGGGGPCPQQHWRFGTCLAQTKVDVGTDDVPPWLLDQPQLEKSNPSSTQPGVSHYRGLSLSPAVKVTYAFLS
jgi:hypothetical protein